MSDVSVVIPVKDGGPLLEHALHAVRAQGELLEMSGIGPTLATSITARNSLLNIEADIRPSQFFRGTLDDVRL